MKKFLSVFLIVSILSVLFAASGFAATQYAMCSTPTHDGTVYVRSVAGAGKPVVGVASNGDTLIVLKKGNTWHKVRVIRSGIEGWMYGQYIVFLGTAQDSSSNSGSSGGAGGGTGTYTPDASTSDKDQMINKYGTISSSDGYANLRWGPSTSFGIIGRVYNSTQVAVLELNGSWYRCEAGSGRVGYINKKLVRLTDNTIYSTSGLQGVVRSSDGYATVRSGAGTSYGSLYTLSVGNAITVYGASGDWFRITEGSYWNSAYLYKNLVRFYSAAVTTGNVNLRKGPNKTYGIIRALSNGTRVTLLATDGSFCRVDTGKEIAYVSKKYLSY